jgi:hypothetical protein
MQLIQAVTVGSGGTSAIEFTGLSSTLGFTDLLLLLSLRSNQTSPSGFAQVELRLQINNATSGYSIRRLRGDGSAANSDTNSGESTLRLGESNNVVANTFSSHSVYFPNAFSSAAKSFSVDQVNENNTTATNMSIGAALFNNTATISSIKLTTAFFTNPSEFSQYSSATLYGITAGSSGGVVVS